MEPSWHRNRSKIDANCEIRFFEKSCSGCSLGSIFVILGVEVGSKNRLKNGVQDGWHLGIDFSWILVDFWGHVGRQNGAKIDPKRRQKTMQKTAETRLPKKSQQESQPARDTSGFRSWEGVGGGINPSPREEGSG